MRTQRTEAEWDAEIETDFRRVVSATKAAGRKKRGGRYVGAPITFLAEVYRLTRGRAPMVVALLIYRRTCICKSRTVTLPGVELAEFGIDRSHKRKILKQLATTGLIRIEATQGRGRSVPITLLRKPTT